MARVGKRKQPTYRFIVNESSRDTYGKALEILGHYNPFQKIIEIKKDRVLYWISKGAKLSPTVNNIFIDQNIISGEKVRASKSKKKGDEAPAAANSAAQQPPAPETPAAAPATEVKTEAPPAVNQPVEEKKDAATT